jgi:phytoene desaturase
VMERLVNRDFRTTAEFLDPAIVPLLFKVKALAHHYANMGRYFDEPRLKAAFTFQDVYMGLSPFEAPATFSMMPYTELEHGVWYPRGGMYSVVEALMQIARQAGAEFRFDASVEHIAADGPRVDGVVLEGAERVEADAVLANADLPYVYQALLPPNNMSGALDRRRFSCSVISFFWGVKKRYEVLGPHTLFLADDYRENFESIDRDLDLPRNPSLYVHAPARMDAAMAPAGEDTLIAIVPVGHLSSNGDQDWHAMQDEARRHVFRRLKLLGITDLESSIKFEFCYTPQAWRERYNLVKGSTHGLCHNLMQLGCFRPPNRHPRYRNLYFAGASTHPGTGVPTALVSGRLAAQRLVDELGA